MRAWRKGLGVSRISVAFPVETPFTSSGCCNPTLNSRFCGLQIQDYGASKVKYLVRALFLAYYIWLPSYCVLRCVCMGTNIFNYSVFEMGSHVPEASLRLALWLRMTSGPLLPPFGIRVLVLEVCALPRTPCPVFWGLNSGLCACKASLFPGLNYPLFPFCFFFP